MEPIQVYEGSDDPRYRLAELREHGYRHVMKLEADLRKSAQYLRNPSMITVRLVFIDQLCKYLRGSVTWSSAVTAYRDLQEISSLYVALKNHDSMVKQIIDVLEMINECHELDRIYSCAA